MRNLLALSIAAALLLPTNAIAEESKSSNLFARNNLVAWCVVPFDASKRSPVKRAAMLKRLGFTRLAYDWRAEHVDEFEEEITALKKQGIEMFAFWSTHDAAFRLFKKHNITPQIWKTAPSPKLGDAITTHAERVSEAARQLLPLVKKTKRHGCKLGLYNHGEWGGDPENLVAVCRYLREKHDASHVGIVYNLHHGHTHIKDFAKSLKLMQPYLLCLNLNGMNDNAKPKILPIGQGQHDARLLQTIRQSRYAGPIGILDHRNELDAEKSLKQNLDGLDKLVRPANN